MMEDWKKEERQIEKPQGDECEITERETFAV